MTNNATWKLNWLEAIADAGAAKQLTPLAVLIAIKFATWYMNKSETWSMGAKSLAKLLGRDRRNIRDAIAELKEGWLIQTSEGGGDRAHSYRLPDQYQERGGSSTPPASLRGGVVAPPLGGVVAPPVAPYYRKEERHTTYAASSVRAATKEGSLDGHTDRQNEPTPKGGVSRKERKQAQLDPAEWIMTPADLEAAAEIAGWDATRAQDEFEGTGGCRGFRPFYADPEAPQRTSNIRTVDDIAAYWRKWCTRGLGFDQREAAQSSRGNGSRYYNKSDPTQHRRTSAAVEAMAEERGDLWSRASSARAAYVEDMSEEDKNAD